MTLEFKLFVDARTPKKAEVLLSRVMDRMAREASDVRIEGYPKTNGHVVRFRVELTAGSWAEAVVEAIELGQRIGYGWTLSGSVLDDPGASSDQSRVSGVTVAEWALQQDSEDSSIDSPDPVLPN